MKRLLVGLMLLLCGSAGAATFANAFTTNANPAAIPVPGLVAPNLIPSGSVYTNIVGGEVDGAGVFKLTGMNTSAAYVLIPGTNAWETNAGSPGTGITDFGGACDSGANLAPLVFTPCSSTMYVYFNAAASVGSSNVSAQVYQLNVNTALKSLYVLNLTTTNLAASGYLINPPTEGGAGWAKMWITNGEITSPAEFAEGENSLRINEAHGGVGNGAEWEWRANQVALVLHSGSHFQFGLGDFATSTNQFYFASSQNLNSGSNFTSSVLGFQDEFTNLAHGDIQMYWNMQSSNYDAVNGNAKLTLYAPPATNFAAGNLTFGLPVISFDSLGPTIFWQGITTPSNMTVTGTITTPTNAIVGGNLTVSGTATIGINANVQGSLIIGNPTNTATGTLIRTNFISGQIYTNIYGRPISISANATLTTAGVSGNSSLALLASGYLTNYSGLSTIVTSIASSYTNVISMGIPPGQTYTFTNVSAGAGDSASVTGGQILVQ